MTIDPNLLSVTMHLNELERQALELHRSRQIAGEARAHWHKNLLPVVNDWATQVASFFFAPRGSH